MWSKLIAGVLKGFQIAQSFLPLITGIAPNNPKVQETVNAVSDDLTKVAGIVTTVEAIGASLKLDGPAKLTAAGPLVAQVFLQSEFVIGHKVKDEARFKAGVDKATSGVVDILSSLE
jgi:hypothetical protein